MHNRWECQNLHSYRQPLNMSKPLTKSTTLPLQILTLPAVLFNVARLPTAKGAYLVSFLWVPLQHKSEKF